MTGEKCPLEEYCHSFDGSKVTKLDCDYKSSDQLCFKGLVFDVGGEVMDKLRERTMPPQIEEGGLVEGTMTTIFDGN